MNICNLDIDHFNLLNLIEKTPLRSLKNLPTTWGLRHAGSSNVSVAKHSEKPPHHMGIKTVSDSANFRLKRTSEKPPHHMGIKTGRLQDSLGCVSPLKNLPTTWGLRLGLSAEDERKLDSEKPPHHMGIKTQKLVNGLQIRFRSEKPPHHMGIKTLLVKVLVNELASLKNLPTTWGLRPNSFQGSSDR